MAQIFHPSTNTISKLTIFGAVFLIGGLLWLLAELNRSDYVTQANVVRPQPVPFSHKHHVSGLGIDCRYCHTAVEQSAFAGIPSTSTCMNCHSQIWTNSPMLEPVRESYRTGQPLRWTRVHNLAEFAYFNHSIHVNKGVGCATCHGPVDQMPLIAQQESLLMEWCLDCHRNPERYLRPREEVFNMSWTAPRNQSELGLELVRKYNVRTEQLTDCSVCHR
jgi:formate-dependent nitrite reductase cytochrome c552 subunit